MPRSRSFWIAAALSLGVGAWLSLDPRRLADFDHLFNWVGFWSAGVSPFTPDIGADYPPWALVTLAPFSWVASALPGSMAAPLWVVVNIVLAVVTVSRLMQAVPEADDTRRWLATALVAAACFRVLGQFSILSFALALIGATHRSPVWGGVWLGLSLMKPQVGGALWLAHLLWRDWRRVGVAAAVPVALTLVAAWHLGQSPVALVRDWVTVVSDTHGGSIPFLGHTELESWLWRWFATGTSMRASLVMGGVLLLPGLIWVWRQRPLPDVGARPSGRLLEWYGFCGVVSLLATRHLSYDFLLLLPLVVAWRHRTWWVVALAGWLVIEPPGWWRQVLEPLSAPAWMGIVLELDRVLVVLLWCVLTVRLLRESHKRLNMT